MEIWSISKRIQILTFLIGLISAEKDILEFLRPDKRNPPQLNEFLSTVLDHQNDFKWIRDFSQNFNIMDIDSMQHQPQEQPPHGGPKKRRHGTYLSSKSSRQNGHNSKYMTNGEYRHNNNNKKARSSHNYHHYKPHQRYLRHKHTYKRNTPTNDVYPYMYENEDEQSFLEPHHRDVRRPIPRKLRTRLQKLNRMRRHAKKVQENLKKREMEAEILTKSNFGDVPVEGVKFPNHKEGGGSKLKLPNSLDEINFKEYSKDSQGGEHSGDQNKIETHNQDELSKRNPKIISYNESLQSKSSDATEEDTNKIKKRDMKIAIMENGKLIQEFTHNDNGGSYLVDFKNNNAMSNPQDPPEGYQFSNTSNPENNQQADSEKESENQTDEIEAADSNNNEERQAEPEKPTSNNIKSTMNSIPKKKLPNNLKPEQNKVMIVSNENANAAYHNESALCSSGIEGKNGIEKIEGIQVNKEKCPEAPENNNVSSPSSSSTAERAELVVKEDQNRNEDYKELLRDMMRKRLAKKITDMSINNDDDELIVNDEIKDFLRQNPQYVLAERPDGTGNHLLLVPYGNYPTYNDIQDPNPPYGYGTNFGNDVYPPNYFYRNDPYLHPNMEKGNNIRVVSNPKYNGNQENIMPKMIGDVPIKNREQYEDLARENPPREYPNKYTVKSYVINNENINKADKLEAKTINKIISRQPHDDDLLKQDNSSSSQMTTEYLLFPLKTLLDKKLGTQKIIIPPASEQQPPSKQQQQQSQNGTDFINTALKKITQSVQPLTDELSVEKRSDFIQKLNRLISRAEDNLRQDKRNILLSAEDFEEITTETSKFKEEKNFRDLLMDIARSKRYRHLRESSPGLEKKSNVRKKRSYPSFDVDDYFYDLGMDDNLAKRTETEYTEEQDPYIDNKTKQYNKKKRTNNSLANPSIIEDNGDLSSWFYKFNKLNPITKRKTVIDNNVKPARLDKSKLDQSKLKNFEKVDIEFLRLKNKLGPNNMLTKPTLGSKFNWKNIKTKNEYKRTNNNPKGYSKIISSRPAIKNHFPEHVGSSTESNDEKLLHNAATKDYEIEGLLNGKFEKYYKFYKSMEKHLNNRPYAHNFDVYESLQDYDMEPFSQYNDQQSLEMPQLYPYFQERALRSYPPIYRNRQQPYFDLENYNQMNSLQRSKRDSSNITVDNNNSTTGKVNIRQKRELEEDFSQYDNTSNQEESPEEADNINLDTRGYERMNNKLFSSEFDRNLNTYNAYDNDPKFLEQFAHHRQKSKKAHPKTDEREKSDNPESRTEHLFPERNSNDAPLRIELEERHLPRNDESDQAYTQRLFKRSNPAEVHKDVRRQDFQEVYKMHPWMKMERLEKGQNERGGLEKRDENDVHGQICSKATDEPPEIKMDTCHRGSTPHPILSFRTEDPKLANILTQKPSTASTTPETTASGPPNEGAMIGLEDVENGRLAADIVSGVFAEVANCPNLQKFSKGLSAKNSKNLNKIQFETPKASEDKEDSVEQQHLLESVRNVLGKLVNNQIQRRMCQHLPAELRKYLNVITSIQTNPSDIEQKQKQRDSSNTLENEQMAYLYNIPKENPKQAGGAGKTEAGQAVEEKAGVMKQLLDKYNSLDPECKAKAAPVKEYIDKHLQSCNSMMQATNKDSGAMEGSKQNAEHAAGESTNSEPASESQSTPIPESPGGSAIQQPIIGENNPMSHDDTEANQPEEEGGEGPGDDRNQQENEGDADSLIEKELESVGLGRKAKTWRPKFSLDNMLKQKIGGAGERGEAEEPAEAGAEKEGGEGEEEVGNEENGNEGENEEEGSEENMESQDANIIRSKRNFGNLYKRDTDKDLHRMRESMKYRKLANAVEKLKRSEMRELESLKDLKRDTSEDRYSSIKSKNKEMQDLGDTEEYFQEPLAYS